SGALVMQAASAAVPINFRPGAAQPCDENVNRMDTTTPATLDQYVGSSGLTWMIVNENAVTAGLPDPNHVFFETNSGTNVLAAGAQFNFSFTLRLVDNGPGGVVYGVDDPASLPYLDNTRTSKFPTPVAFPSHVFMTADMQGVLTVQHGIGSYPPADLVHSIPHF